MNIRLVLTIPILRSRVPVKVDRGKQDRLVRDCKGLLMILVSGATGRLGARLCMDSIYVVRHAASTRLVLLGVCYISYSSIAVRQASRGCRSVHRAAARCNWSATPTRHFLYSSSDLVYSALSLRGR